MSHFDAYAPIRFHGPGRRVTRKEAHRLVATYLKRSETEPELHPDSILGEEEPVFATPGTEGLVMTNLRRLEAGLRGEHLAAEIEDEFGVTSWNTAYGANTGEDRANIDKSLVMNGPTAVAEEKDAGEGMWQDKAEFEREQEDLEGDIGPRTQIPTQARPGQDLMPRMQDVPDADTTAQDKARKKRKEDKRVRKKEEQKLREKERRRVKEESSDEEVA